MKFIDDIRRKNLSDLAFEKGGVAALARLLEREESQVSQWINGSSLPSGKKRGMRSETARWIEVTTGKHQGWLDERHDTIPGYPPAEQINEQRTRETSTEYKELSPAELQQETIRLLSGMDIDDAALWLETARIGANKARRISAIQPAGLSPEEEDILNHLRKTTLNQDKIQLIKDLIKAKITPEETTQPERKRAAG